MLRRWTATCPLVARPRRVCPRGGCPLLCRPVAPQSDAARWLRGTVRRGPIFVAAVVLCAGIVLPGCDAGVDDGSAPVAVSLAPGSVGDCPVPHTSTADVASMASSTTASGIVTGHLGGPIGHSATPTPTNTIPGYPGLAMPSAGPLSPGDASITVLVEPQAVTLHVGRTLRVAFVPSQAVEVPATPDPTVLQPNGRSCQADGTAVFAFTALRPGTVVLMLFLGPRCLHDHPPCMPSDSFAPLRVDVVP
jgi:hypothetical protein